MNNIESVPTFDDQRVTDLHLHTKVHIYRCTFDIFVKNEECQLPRVQARGPWPTFLTWESFHSNKKKKTSLGKAIILPAHQKKQNILVNKTKFVFPFSKKKKWFVCKKKWMTFIQGWLCQVICYSLPLEKGLFFWRNLNFFHLCFVPSLVEIGQMVLEKKIFKSCRCIFTIISHWKKTWPFNWTYLYPRILSVCTKFGKIGPVAQEKMKMLEVYRWTEAHFKSFPLRWAKNYTVNITKCNSFKVYFSVN